MRHWTTSFQLVDDDANVAASALEVKGRTVNFANFIKRVMFTRVVLLDRISLFITRFLEIVQNFRRCHLTVPSWHKANTRLLRQPNL